MWRAASAVAIGCVLAALPGCRQRATVQPTVADDPSATRGVTASGSTTGAIATLSPDELLGGRVHDVAEMLRGRVPGLQVLQLANGDISLRIRGSDSILSDGEPLVVLDGAPVAPQNVSQVLRALNPPEIARIEVLKDVASTSGYGIRGAHGVVVITMKH